MNHTRSSVMRVMSATGVWKMVDISLVEMGRAERTCVGWLRRQHGRQAA